MKYTNHLKTLLCLAASIALIGCSATRYDRSTGQYIDDNATTARVNSALSSDSILKASDINIGTFRGNVHLTGYVDHPVQKERASQITRNVKGVEWFKNDIVVKSELPSPQQMSESQPITDPAGASRFNHNQQQQNSASNRSGASSSKSDGWEKGSLSNYDPAAQVSSKSGGTINGTASASANISEPSGSSNELVQRINTQLRSDSASAAQNVRVEAEPNGNVTLRGMVSSDQEKRSIENRVKGIQGVSRVNNELEVQE